MERTRRTVSGEPKELGVRFTGGTRITDIEALGPSGRNTLMLTKYGGSNLTDHEGPARSHLRRNPRCRVGADAHEGRIWTTAAE
ncbi:hypothetical protein DL765_002687 [Monosporascus sp. GIB2]|nr:hypothetical protein DL765_002687 [Monosporascus sp. GIB2]